MSKSPRQSSQSDTQSVSEPSFENALAELESIVAQMESGNLSLEQALAAHRRGLQLAKLCQQRLEAAQQQVKVLEGDVLKPLAQLRPEPGAED
ncbi:MAG TPA: exodeoxyribonuclease VII small subunit [Burkholderiales bacterium]|nr:exodeoxyribonuclease VII small subunit [Burkholderiales bacterium]